jgi:hypothetical protein
MPTKIPARVQKRIAQQLKKYQATVADARRRDINETDTAHLAMDILCDVFGYRKIEEITSEKAIRGTFADLAVTVGGQFRFLVEVKAINTELKDAHVTQVVNYAANLPADWVLLTNAARWQAWKVNFNKPIAGTLVLDVDLCACNLKSRDVADLFGGLSREVFTPDSMSRMFKTRQAMSRYSIAQLLLSPPVVTMVRRELRKLAVGLNPDIDDVRDLISDHVVKRELIEAEEAKAAARAVRRLSRPARTAAPKIPPAPIALAPQSAAMEVPRDI